MEVGDAEVAVRFSGGPTVHVDRASARVRQEGPDTARIDWLYRVHYVQWTGVGGVDKALSLVAIAGTWLLTALGFALLLARRRRSS